YDTVDAIKERSQMITVQDELEDQIDILREEKANLERASQIEKQAYAELNSTLKVLQAELLELKEELAFYRGIVSPRDASEGLRLQRFQVEPNGQTRGFRSKVVLTQVLKNDRVAKGLVRISVEGLVEGQGKTLTLKDITEKQIKELKFNFKYFQNLEEDLVLPEGFTPVRATIQVIPSKGKSNMIEKTIDWPNEEKAAYVRQQRQET
ncbi:MAG: hypothetical protein OEY07_12185, partial [Gammaproteobacteria bacterium]|nr:hypothetical protein [Gammaproteobacteria bacterium]